MHIVLAEKKGKPETKLLWPKLDVAMGVRVLVTLFTSVNGID